MPLSRLTVDLVPDGLEERVGLDTARPRASTVYARCYQAVFPGERADNLSRHADYDRKLTAAAAEAGCGVEAYIMARMLMHKSIVGSGRFFAGSLFSVTAPRAVREARLAAIEARGSGDTATLGGFLGVTDVLTKLAARVTESDELVGRWVVGYKRAKPGRPDASLYQLREYVLNPYWLAIEQSYATWLTGPDVPQTAELTTHRDKVREARGYLQKNKALTAKLCRLRSDRFIRVVERVVGQYGYQLDDFMAPSPVRHAVKFWGRLGLAIQQLDCLELVSFFGPSDHA